VRSSRPIAALITGGAHLLLAMLECCITERGGHYLFCDTDSMCIVTTRNGGSVACPNESPIKALSWKEVEEIARRFESLNRYDKTKVRGVDPENREGEFSRRQTD
jgi:hypothetical protein